MKRKQNKTVNNKQVFFYTLILASTLMMSCYVPVLKVTYDYDRYANFTTYKTFSMYNLTTSGNVNQLNAERIQNSIRAEMIKKGMIESSNNPDLMINAVTILKDKRSFSASTNYHYGSSFRPYAYWALPGVAGYTTVQSYEYKDGSLVIDVVDAKTKKLVWQGSGNGQLDQKPEDPTAMINRVVSKIMEAFPGSNEIKMTVKK